MVAGQHENIGVREYLEFNMEYLINLAPGLPDYDLWMYNPPAKINPSVWTCNFKHWTHYGRRGGGTARFNRYCMESHAVVPLVIALAFLVALMLSMHIWAWVSARNKSPLFVSAAETNDRPESDHPTEADESHND